MNETTAKNFREIKRILDAAESGSCSTREQLESQLATAAGLLMRIEWAASYNPVVEIFGFGDNTRIKACPICKCREQDGHALYCLLDRWFQRPRALPRPLSRVSDTDSQGDEW